MARLVQDREDLLREATALVERVELRVEGFTEPIVAGFRRGGEASVFFGADPVYQFNAHNQLRRAFVAGRLIKAEEGALVELERRRGEGEVQLVRHELDASECENFLTAARERLSFLAAQFDARFYQLVGQVPADGEVVSLFRQWLAALPRQIRPAARAHVKS